MRDSNINNLNNHVENSDSQHDRSLSKKDLKKLLVQNKTIIQ